MRPERLINIAAAADLLSVSSKTIRRFISSGALPHHRVGRQIRISQGDLTVFLALRRTNGTGGQ